MVAAGPSHMTESKGTSAVSRTCWSDKACEELPLERMTQLVAALVAIVRLVDEVELYFLPRGRERWYVACCQGPPVGVLELVEYQYCE